MKKKPLVVALIIVVAILIFAFLMGISEDIAIEEYIAIIDIDEYGNMIVEETYVMNYKGDYNERWRDINYKKAHYKNPLFSGVDMSLYKNDKAYIEYAEILSVTKDGEDITRFVDTGYSFNGDEDKTGVPVECYPESEYCESMYFDATKAGGLAGEVIIVYQYKLNGMMTHYNDVSELNYNIFKYMEGTIKKATVNIFLSSNVNEYREEDFYCYGHGVTRGNINQAIIEKDYASQPDITYSATNIKKDQFLEMRVLFPRTLFSNVDEKNVVKIDMFDKIISYENDLALESNIKYYVSQICIGITGLVIIVTVIVFIIVYKKYDKEYEPKFQGDYYRELPEKRTPAEMSYLYYFGTFNDEDITATVLDLIRKEYFILDQNGEEINDDDPDFILRKGVNIDIGKLEYHEKVIFDWFLYEIGDGEKVSFSQIEGYGKSYKNATIYQSRTKDFQTSVKSTCEKHHFFEKTMSLGKIKALAYGVILVVLSFAMASIAKLFNVDAMIELIIIFIIGVFYIVYVLNIKKRSVEGNEEYAKWKAFKNFLVDFSSFEDYPIPGVAVWEEYLVYATSLKIADKVMKQLEVKLPNFEENESTYFRYTVHRRHRGMAIYYGLTHSLNTARMNTNTTIAAHNVSKAGRGHGGGFSSGSSFGGGGGGGRSR